MLFFFFFPMTVSILEATLLMLVSALCTWILFSSGCSGLMWWFCLFTFHPLLRVPHLIKAELVSLGAVLQPEGASWETQCGLARGIRRTPASFHLEGWSLICSVVFLFFQSLHQSRKLLGDAETLFPNCEWFSFCKKEEKNWSSTEIRAEWELHFWF